MATTKALELAQFGTNLVVDGATGVATQSSLTLSGTTASTSTTTGSLVTLGGAGIAENLYVGGNTVISGDVGAVNATLSGDVGAVNATLSGNLGAVNTTLSGNLGAVNATLSGDIGAVNTTLSGYLRGPASFVIDPSAYGDDTGTVVIAGNLQVDGLTTTINSTTLTVDDKNIVLASGAVDSAAANGAGITVDGANASLTYVHAGTNWSFNKPLNVTGIVTADGLIVGDTSSSASRIFITSSSTGESELRLGDTDTDAGSIAYTNSNDTMTFRAAAAARMTLASTGIDVTGTVTSDGLTVDGTGSFTATAPLIDLYESDTTDLNSRIVSNSSSLRLQTVADNGSNASNRLLIDHATGNISFYDTSGTAKLIWKAADSSLGIGYTPDDWYVTFNAIQVGARGSSIFGRSENNDVSIGSNMYINAAGANTYINTDEASYYQQLNGIHAWNSAVSGTAGDPISFSRKMTLLANGNLGIGTDSPGAALEVNRGSASFAAIFGAPGGSGKALLFKDNATTPTKYNFLVGSQYSIDNAFEITPSTTAGGTTFSTPAIAVLSNGNVGIGTNSPDQPLHVKGVRPIRIERAGVGEFEISIDNTITGDSLDFVIEPVSGSNSAGFQVRTRNTAGTLIEALNVNHDGDVGIGTDAPVQTLDVDGSIGTRQVRHSIRPSLNLDFANSKELDSRITFYRDSIATYYDSKGTLKYANANEPRFDHDPLTGESKGLLIEEARENTYVKAMGQNINFGGTSVAGATVSPSGKFDAPVLSVTGDGYHRLQLNKNLVNNTPYTFSIYAKMISGTNLVLSAFTMQFIDIGGNSGNSAYTAPTSTTDVGNGWYRLIFPTFTPNVSSLYVTYLYANISGTNNYTANYEEFSVWNPQLEIGSFSTSAIPIDTTFTSRASSATYFDETGILRTAPVNGARYGYSSPYLHQSFNLVGTTLGMRYEEIAPRSAVETGLILENAATNLEEYGILSNSSTNPTIGSGATFVNTTETTAPDGLYTASKFTFTGTSDRLDTNYVTYSDGEYYTLSLWVKGVANTAIRCSILTNLGNNVEPTIRLTGEWQKISVTKKFLASETGTLVRTHAVIIRGEPGTAVTSTNGEVCTYASYVYTWGMQVELGITATSTIPTYGGTATRAADVASSVAYTRAGDEAYIEKENFDDFFNRDEGTWHVDASTVMITSSSAHRIDTLNISAGRSSSNIYYIGLNAVGGSNKITFYSNNNGLNDINISSGLAGEQDFKVGASYAVGSASLSVNGSTPSTDSTVTLSSNIDTLCIGSRNGVSQYQNGCIRKIAYYDQALSDAELQALTENN